MESIADVGLLHPVVVTPEGRLIAGQRRLEACRLLGWTEVPVTVVDLYEAARDKMARYLRVGRTTIERAEAVVDAAEENPKNTDTWSSKWTTAAKWPELSED